jgi:phosphoribosylglycinamide formyltransferase-1
MTGSRRLAVLVSGRGSNLTAIADACADGRIPARIALVLCNVAGAPALTLARERGLRALCIPHQDYPDREAFEDALQRELLQAGADFIALAGFMRVLTQGFVRQYCGSLLNIHPSLLPKYPGLHTHRRALEAGDRESGATVHYVIPALDAGPAVAQGRVPIVAGDTPETLAERVQRLEHRLYPLVLAWCLSGRAELRDGVVLMDGEKLTDGGIALDKLEYAQGA